VWCASRCRLSVRGGAPGEKAFVLESGLVIGERSTGESFDPAARRFEDGLPSGCILLHRRAEARVEVGFARGDHTEFERAAVFLALAHGIAREKLGEASAVVMRAAVDDNETIRRRRADPNRLGLAAITSAGRGPRSASDVGDADRRTMNDPQDRDPVLDETDIDSELAILGDELVGSVERSTAQKRAVPCSTPSAASNSSEAIGMSGKASVSIAQIIRSEARSASVTGVLSVFY
jgi:hypothetical protein